jgi:hypothetical protein
MTTNTDPRAVLVAELTDALRAMGATFILEKLHFAEEPGRPEVLLSSTGLYGGRLDVRVEIADEWSDAPIGTAILAVNWGHHAGGAFTCGTYKAGLHNALWNLSAALAFAQSNGTLPSGD